MCKHGFHFIHEMHYSLIAYFQGVMTGKGVKREVGVWSWQETRPDPLHLLAVIFNVQHYSAISQTVCRLNKLIIKDDKVKLQYENLRGSLMHEVKV